MFNKVIAFEFTGAPAALRVISLVASSVQKVG